VLLWKTNDACKCRIASSDSPKSFISTKIRSIFHPIRLLSGGGVGFWDSPCLPCSSNISNVRVNATLNRIPNSGTLGREEPNGSLISLAS
jgi:hypothetical protein